MTEKLEAAIVALQDANEELASEVSRALREGDATRVLNLQTTVAVVSAAIGGLQGMLRLLA